MDWGGGGGGGEGGNKEGIGNGSNCNTILAFNCIACGILRTYSESRVSGLKVRTMNSPMRIRTGIHSTEQFGNRITKQIIMTAFK
jgi:hypothetical protein